MKHSRELVARSAAWFAGGVAIVVIVDSGTSSSDQVWLQPLVVIASVALGEALFWSVKGSDWRPSDPQIDQHSKLWRTTRWLLGATLVLVTGLLLQPVWAAGGTVIALVGLCWLVIVAFALRLPRRR